MTTPLKGIPRDEVEKIMREGVPRAELFGDSTTPVNAVCNKCGEYLRSAPFLLKHIRTGVVDHKVCGGTFKAIP